MTNPVPPRTFTRDEFTTQVLGAHETIADFTKFLMRRFAAFTQQDGGVRDTRERDVAPVTDPWVRTNAGYGHWRVAANWMRVMTEATDLPEPYVLIEHYMDDDRGPGSVGKTVRVPLSFVFGEVERDAEYEKFLRLKAQFEPEPGAKQSKARLEAARVLWVQSRPETERTGNGEHLADPSNREQAAEAYRMALSSLMLRSGLKDIRRAVHDAAHTLGLGTYDIKSPQSATSATGSTGDTPTGTAAQGDGQTSPESPYDDPRAGQANEAPEQAATELGLTLLIDLAERLTDHGVAAHEQAGVAYEKVQAAFTLTGKQVFGDRSEKVGKVIDDVANLLGFATKKP